MTCEYCNSLVVEPAIKCANCGAPISFATSDPPDFRHCPLCRRKLLALASPACSYCGRRLPDTYLKAREADLRRIMELAENHDPIDSEGQLNAFFCQTGRRKRGGSSSALGPVDITGLIDFFS